MNKKLLVICITSLSWAISVLLSIIYYQSIKRYRLLIKSISIELLSIILGTHSNFTTTLKIYLFPVTYEI